MCKNFSLREQAVRPKLREQNQWFLTTYFHLRRWLVFSCFVSHIKGPGSALLPSLSPGPYYIRGLQFPVGVLVRQVWQARKRGLNGTGMFLWGLTTFDAVEIFWKGFRLGWSCCWCPGKPLCFAASQNGAFFLSVCFQMLGVYTGYRADTNKKLSVLPSG